MHKTFVSSIEGLVQSRLAAVSADASIVDVALLLSDPHIGLVIVCNADGAMQGVVSKTNIVQLISRHRDDILPAVADELMTRDVTSCLPTTSLADVLSLMEKRGFVNLPVVDEKLKPIGVVNAGDVFRTLLSAGKLDEAHLRDYVMGIGYG